MVKNHGKKSRAKKRAQRTGASHTSAAAGTLHLHEPLPDVTVLPLIPHGSGPLDLDLAARLVAACHAECGPCQKSLAAQMVVDRTTLTALAGAVYGMVPTSGVHLSEATRSWVPAARAAVESGSGSEAAMAVAAMSEQDAAALLEDALDIWAAGDPVRLANLVKLVTGSRQRPADPMDAFREAGVKVVTLDDLDLGDDIDPYHLAPAYGVMPMRTNTPDGQPMPMLLLYPETEDAGIEDLEARTDWKRWGLHGMPDMDPRWRVRARISDRSLQGLVHIGADGEDDIELWRAAESVSMPAEWWDLLDRVQHMLVVGPVTEPEAPGAMEAASEAGELLAVVARVVFA
ncbi:hypothetical protein ACOMD4_38045 [Streptomyces anulatus]|uniref:hypothetical protein n=1 Tax=Streptomyces anulatus TaxID=1892 RepID=UPI003B7891A8